MASQFLWTSKSVDLLLELSVSVSYCLQDGLQSYYAGHNRTFKAVATVAVCSRVGYWSAIVAVRGVQDAP
jgi:hypothetical protein